MWADDNHENTLSQLTSTSVFLCLPSLTTCSTLVVFHCVLLYFYRGILVYLYVRLFSGSNGQAWLQKYTPKIHIHYIWEPIKDGLLIGSNWKVFQLLFLNMVNRSCFSSSLIKSNKELIQLTSSSNYYCFVKCNCHIEFCRLDPYFDT